MRIKEERERNGISQKDLAKMLNVSSAALSQWETGKRDPSPDIILRIADILEVTVDALYGRPPLKGVRIPVLGRVPAGVPIEAIEEIIDWEEIDRATASKGEYFGLVVRGDSMEPRISEGDVLIVKKQSTAETGDIVIAMINGDDATVKKFKPLDSGIMLIPLNSAYEPLVFTAEEVEHLPVSILGIVVESRRKYK